MAKVQILQYPLPGADGGGEETRKDKIYISFLPVKMNPAESLFKNIESMREWQTPYSTASKENSKGESELDIVLDAGAFFNFQIPGDSKTIIQMALPSSSINDSFSHGWNSESSNPEQSMKNFLNTKASETSGKTKMISNAAGGALAAAGKILPTIMLTTYNSTETRKFTWNFQMIPHSREEAIVCQNIIHNFKLWSSPGSFQLDLNVSPYAVIPKISTFDGSDCPLGNMLKLFPCIIEDVSVSYFDNGQIITYKDGMPKSILLSIQTKELIFHTRTSLGNTAIPFGS